MLSLIVLALLALDELSSVIGINIKLLTNRRYMISHTDKCILKGDIMLKRNAKSLKTLLAQLVKLSSP